MKLKVLPSAIAIALTSFSAFSDDGSMVVTATALDQLVQTEINATTLEQKQASDIKDILNTMPSVTVDGNARYSRKVFIRGMEDKFAVVTIDGARQEGQLFHHSGDQTIDPSLLKVAKIELGANSALNGSGVVNGSFSYETKDPDDLLQGDDKFGARIKTSYQSAYERKGVDVAVYTKLNDKLQFMAIANYSEDGDLHIPNKDDVSSKQGELKSGLAKVVFIPNNSNEFKLMINHYSDGGKRQLSGEKSGALYADKEHNYNSINRDTVTLQHAYNPDNDLVNLKSNVYYNRQYMNVAASIDSKYYKNKDGTWARNPDKSYLKDSADVPEQEFNIKTIGGDIRNVSWVGDHELTYGVEGYIAEQSVDSEDGKLLTGNGKAANLTESGKGDAIKYAFDGGKVSAYGLYLQDSFEINDFRLTSGLRYDVHQLGGMYSGTLDQLSPKFKGEYQATNDLRLRVGYGRLFKGASLPEALMIGDPSKVTQGDTKAMTGNNYETGFDYDLSNLLGADNSIIGFTAYKYNLDNQMHPTKNTSLTNKYDAEVWGIETVFTYKLEDLSIYANHSYSDGDQKDLKDNTTSHMNKTGIHNIKAGFNYGLSEEIVFGWDSRFVLGNEYTDEENEKISRPGFGVHNMWAAYNPTFAKDLTINLGVDNLFNKQYAEHTGFGISWGSDKYTSYEVGRNFKASLAYAF